MTLAIQGRCFESQEIHIQIQCTAWQVTLDKSIWQIHKCKSNVYAKLRFTVTEEDKCSRGFCYIAAFIGYVFHSKVK